VFSDSCSVSPALLLEGEGALNGTAACRSAEDTEEDEEEEEEEAT